MSKKDQAQTIYNEMMARGATNEEIVARFIKDLDMTQAGATTYRYNCAKAAKSGSNPSPKATTVSQNTINQSKRPTKPPVVVEDNGGRERIDTRPVFTACIVNDDIISETYSFYEKQDALNKSAYVMHSPTEHVPEQNSRWSKVPQKFLKFA